MEYTGSWKEIWTQKGMMSGNKEDIRIYDGWEKSTSDMRMVADKIKAFLGNTSNKKILEVGCGAGGLARFFESEYIGIDFSKPLVEKCCSFWGKSAIYSEADSLPFRDKYFDYSFSWGVFLYFPNKDYMRRAVDEMKRVTKEVIFIGECPKVSHDEKHLLYSERDFIDLGFEIIEGWSEPYYDERFNCILRCL